MQEFLVRVGTPADTPKIAELMSVAGAGLFEHLLQDVVEGLSVAALLGLAINDENSPYHFENALVADCGGANAGMMLAFPAAHYGLPDAARAIIPDDRLTPVREILTTRVENSFYIHSLAVRPDFARRGLARLLLRAGAAIAADEGYDTLSLHLWSDNRPAMKLYQGMGFESRGIIPVAACERLRYRGPMLLVAADTRRLLA